VSASESTGLRRRFGFYQTILHQPIGKPNLIGFRVNGSGYLHQRGLEPKHRSASIFWRREHQRLPYDYDHVSFVSRTKLAKVG
jgi:hypothetical protein